METNYIVNGLSEDEILTPERLSLLLEEKKYAALKEELASIPAPDLAELFYEIDERYHSLLFRLLSKEQAAEVFVEMDTEHQERLIERFSDRELAEILDELYIDDTVDIIAKRLLGGAKGLYAAAAAAAPERIRDFERISLAELDALLSPAEQRRFITAEARPMGHPYLIRRDAA